MRLDYSICLLDNKSEYYNLTPCVYITINRTYDKDSEFVALHETHEPLNEYLSVIIIGILWETNHECIMCSMLCISRSSYEKLYTLGFTSLFFLVVFLRNRTTCLAPNVKVYLPYCAQIFKTVLR